MKLGRWLVNRAALWLAAALLAPSACWGAGWTAQTSNTEMELMGVWFTDLKNGWAVGREGMVRTTDGGATWAQQEIPEVDDGPRVGDVTFAGIRFANSKCGWAFGGCVYGGFVMSTRDGGANWRAVLARNSLGQFYAVHFPDPANGWAVGDYGLVMNSKDGGRTWTQQAKMTGENLMGVHFIDALRGWAVSNADENAIKVTSRVGGQLLQTVDGGKTWSIVTKAGPGCNGVYSKVFFADQNLGWIGSDLGQLVRTTDGGKTWSVVQTAFEGMILDFQFVTASLAWAVGGGVQCSKDGGATWKLQTGTKGYFRAVHFVDAKNGWIVGQDGVIYHTTTGGE